jgi:hypothetical protein
MVDDVRAYQRHDEQEVVPCPSFTDESLDIESQ